MNEYSMMTQEQMEVEIMKLETENNEIKEIISEMQQEIKKRCSEKGTSISVYAHALQTSTHSL